MFFKNVYLIRFLPTIATDEPDSAIRWKFDNT